MVASDDPGLDRLQGVMLAAIDKLWGLEVWVLAEQARLCVLATLTQQGIPLRGALEHAARCRESLLLVGSGESSEEVARRLGVSVWTVRRDKRLIVDALHAAEASDEVFGPMPVSPYRVRR